MEQLTSASVPSNKLAFLHNNVSSEFFSSPVPLDVLISHRLASSYSKIFFVFEVGYMSGKYTPLCSKRAEGGISRNSKMTNK